MLIIFDCDGVLRSVSWQAIYAAYLAITDYLKINPKDFWIDINDFRLWHDHDWRVNLEKMGVAQESGVSEINRIFHAVYDPYIQVFPWVEDVIGKLALKHDLTILSAALSSSVRDSIGETAEYFSMVMGCEHVKNIKPNPEGILLIIEEMKVKASESIMIGDTNVDILAGKNAGVKTAGVTWGLGLAEELKKLDPDFIFTDPRQLFDIE
jgi:phosphoglycolate phosphatase-like HAD superfamily hydrolase